MKDHPMIFEEFIRNSNIKQREYLSNIFGVSGGAIMFSAWQKFYPLKFSELSSDDLNAIMALAAVSFVFTYLGYYVHKEDI